VNAAAKSKPGRPKVDVIAFRPTKAFKLQIARRRESRVSRDEVVEALESILTELRRAQ
jgi:hypothetical protein